MKSKMNIKSIVIMATIGIISLFFINMSLAVSTGKISVETANLRETADENAKILELLSINDEVEIIEKTGNWYKVKAKGMTGYLRQDLIKVNEQEQPNNTTNNETATNQETQAPVENTVEPTEKPKENTQNNQTEQKVEEKDIELGKQKMAEDTKLKIVPVINATDTIEVKKEEEVNVIEIMNGWVCVEAKTTKGWVRKEKIQKQQTTQEPTQPTVSTVEPTQNMQPQKTEEAKTVIKTLYVNSTSINLRKEANTSSEILANLPVNTAVDVLAQTNGWSQVRVNGKEGYISSSLLSTRKQETARSSSTPRTASTTKQEQTTKEAPVSGNGSSVVAYAKQFIGTKYTYGGSTPATGFDCSGFTSYVYKHFGVSLPRTSGRSIRSRNSSK
ncbi:MAG: SH3 domain-containing protein [Clostridia bacterium]|nr:SH3 domain-containing protein [Clostridia bacterium]